MALCLKSGESKDDCYCPEMPEVKEACPPKKAPECSKYFHEVGAEMTGNHLIIRMEKDKNAKRERKKKNWTPPCDCDFIEIKRPTKTKGPRIVNGGDNNQILFRIHSKNRLNKKEDIHYKPQAIAYKINRESIEPGDQCRKVTVYPQFGGPVSQDVYTDHTTDENHDVYLLRVKKRNNMADGPQKRNMEIELRTPKLKPWEPCPVQSNTSEETCASEESQSKKIEVKN